MKYRFLRYPEGRTKAVTFSYDDGVVFDKKLAEIFTRVGLKATFNLNSAKLREDTGAWNLGIKDIKGYIIDKGHEIAVHGENHIAPAAARPVDSVKEVLFGRLGLEKIFDMTVRGMAYPDSGIKKAQNGNSAQRVKMQLQDLGIVYSRTLGGDNDEFELPNDWYEWMPTAHHDNPKIFEYIDKFLNIDFDKMYCSHRYPRLFYIWGHSFEFDRKNNWDRIEEICSRLAGRSDIWYATNIEIYDYVKAYESLVISADGTRIYNPTLIKVWFDIDGKLYSLSAGEHIKIEA